eukprot:12140190-Heterocapsa_arctica.AAC.1
MPTYVPKSARQCQDLCQELRLYAIICAKMYVVMHTSVPRYAPPCHNMCQDICIYGNISAEICASMP